MCCLHKISVLMGGLLWLVVRPEGSFLEAEEPSLEKKVETDYIIGEIALGAVPFVLYSFTMPKVLVLIFSPVQIHWEANVLGPENTEGLRCQPCLRVMELDFKWTVTSPPQIAAPRLGAGGDRCCLASLKAGFLFPFRSCPCIFVLGFYKRLLIFLVSFTSTN